MQRRMRPSNNPTKALERRCRKALDAKNKRLRKITDPGQSQTGYVIVEAYSGAVCAGEDRALSLLDVCRFCGGALYRDAKTLLTESEK